ncbi:hypothetical protein STVIR_8632 [Streptomyces viridochromogenes Tue57]|uniref:Uncharacterized protein n=1 Tax=Streptomyces viridochromogenes Tue57 TaxID=1160705 RepID=L8P2J8_STRVR|nr:hypothetical protein STVIR_8632 [Streptomyces viridochromogenes Tue57]
MIDREPHPPRRRVPFEGTPRRGPGAVTVTRMANPTT